ncbi:MAG: hypothetical protein ACOYJ6_03840 [Caulobacterales bacterium]|jgi:hypothetical protein
MFSAAPVRFSNLTGYWAGAYLYPMSGAPPVAFNATIEDRDGALVGEIDEPNTFADPAAARLFADLIGVRTGLQVRFVKSVDGTGGANHDIIYDGVASADFMRIDGIWSIPGNWSGGFWMAGIDGALADARAETVEAKLQRYSRPPNASKVSIVR